MNQSQGGETKYIFKGLLRGFEDLPENYIQLTIRAHSEKEAYKKAQKEAEWWPCKLMPNKDGYLIWEQQEVKPSKPKLRNKHPREPPNLNPHELNELVKRIETVYRTTKSGWNSSRLGFIPASEIREIIWKHKIGFTCRYCLTDFRGRYCCIAHRDYYRIIRISMYGPQQPWQAADGDSIDHIKPISMGGLEFDRDNLQWMDLAENIRKGGSNRLRRLQKAHIKVQLQIAFSQAQSLYDALGFGQRPLKNI